MADTRKPSKILADTLGISGKDYDLMKFNARRYERTDAGVEDNILKQIFDRTEAKEFLANENADPDKKDFVYQSRPGEFGKTKVFNASNVLQSIGASVPKKGDMESPEQKLVRIYDENPNFVRNRVKADKDFGAYGADNLPMLIESSRGYKEEKPSLSWPNKVAGSIFYPRSLESMREGRDVSAKDIGGDIAENVLMALPLGLAAGAITKGGRAAKILAGLGAAAAVPLATEVMDANMYNPSENLDRSVFQPSDVAFGTSTNIAAPFMLSRGLGRLGRWTYGGNPLAKQAEREVQKVDDEVADLIKTQVNKGGFVVPDQRTGDRIENMVAKDYQNMLNNSPEYWEAIKGSADFDKGIVNEATIKARNALNKMEEEADDVASRARVVAGYMLAGDSYQDALRKAQALGPLANRMEAEMWRRANPINDAPSPWGAALGSWLTNKYGNNRNASATLGLVSGLLQSVEPDLSLEEKLEDWRDERRQDRADEYRKAKASAVLDAISGEEEADRYWLDKLSKEPWIARGKGDGATSSFKNWWNTRGMRILNDTGLFGGVKE